MNCLWVKLKRKEEYGVVERTTEIFFQNLKCENLLTRNIGWLTSSTHRAVITDRLCLLFCFVFLPKQQKIWGTVSMSTVCIHVVVTCAWGYSARQGRICLQAHPGKMWGAMPNPAFSSDAGGVGREGVCCPQSTPVPVKHVCCSLCSWSSLPCPLQGHPHLCLSSLQKACFFLGFLFGRTGADELMWGDSIATTAENTGRMAHFFRVGSILF